MADGAGALNEENFGRLVDADVREAFAHEALKFTPWLCRNLDRLAEAVGFDLELIDSEVRVETSRADIHARCPQDEAAVLIENQLAGSDHSHLGQILTYLAGLKTRRVVWIATSFKDEHLSAIRWLNDHTPPEFAFFAVALRVVKIVGAPQAADSALAPLFDVIEKPNEWDKRIESEARAALTKIGEKRRAFWEKFQEAYPDFAKDGAAGGGSAMWRKAAGGKLIISYYLARRGVGLLVRPPSGIEWTVAAEILTPLAEVLESRLGAPLGPNTADHFLWQEFSCDFASEEDFARIAAWLAARVTAYQTALDELVETSLPDGAS